MWFCLWRDSTLATMARSGPLSPHFVNSDSVVAETICSTVHVPHDVLAWSGATVSFKDLWVLPKQSRGILLLPLNCVCWVSPKRREYSVSAATAAVPARENNVPAVATAPGIFFQPLRSRLACPGFSEQNSADSVNSKTTGITNRIINILPYLLKGGDCHY